MQTFIIVVLCVVFVTSAFVRSEEKYTDKYDNVDIDQIIQNERLYKNYFNCFQTGLKCPPPAEFIRDNLQDAIRTNCSKCSDIQYTKGKKLLNYVITDRPDDFLLLEQIHDPQHELRKRWANKLKREGLVLPEIN